MKQKFNAYTKDIYNFVNLIYVECPSCKNRALVSSNIFNINEPDKISKIVCAQCGFNKIASKINSSKHSKTDKDNSYLMGVNCDPYFRLNLCLQKDLADGLLWAYNYEHLEFIEKYISADLRERSLNNISN